MYLTLKNPQVLRNASSMGVDPFIKPRDIASGNKKLNYAFLAQIFNEFPGTYFVNVLIF